MKLVQSILVKNPCYKAGRTIKVEGLMLHSIGCPQPNANVFVNGWNSESHKNSCVHAFIDGNDGIVYQTLPWNHRGWHCASGVNGSGNNTHIGVEMCEPACIKYTGGSTFICSNLEEAKAVAKRTYKSAVELFAFLCEEFNLNPLEDGVIISHAEGFKRGISSNHGDPEHLWKQLGLEYTMDSFRQDVKNAMSSSDSTSTKPTTSTANKTFPTTPFEVQVLISDLNYRSTSSMSGKVLGQTGKGIFTIVDVENGWGLLKSYEEKRDGWIYLENASYCKIGSTVNVFKPYRVKVTADTLNIRKGAGTNYDKNGVIKDKGVYTIVAEAKGKGATKWGLLKSYEEKRNGWISLDYVEKV